MNRVKIAGVLERVETFLADTGARSDEPPTHLWIVTHDSETEFGQILRHALLFRKYYRITIASWSSLSDSHGTGNEPLPDGIIALTFTGRLPLNELNAWSTMRLIPWIRCTVDDDAGIGDVGPSFLPGTTFCYRCFSALYLSTQGFTPYRQQPHFSRATFLCHLFAAELANIQLANQPDTPLQGFRRYDLRNMSSQYLLRTSVPSCSCRSGIHQREELLPISDPHVPVPLAFEDAIARHFVVSHNSDRASRNTTHIRNSLFKQEFPNSRRVRLPAFDAYPPESEITFAALCEISFFSVGLRWIDRSRHSCARFAASAGNLGSSNISFVTNDVNGLPAGFYRYRAVSHDLVHIQSKAADTLSIFALPIIGNCHNVLVVFSACYGRLRQKYGHFAYKLMFIDAGVAFSHANLIAGSLGFMLERHSEDLRIVAQRALNSETEEECVTLLAILSPRRSKRHQAPRTLNAICLHNDPLSPELLRNSSPSDLTNRLFQDSFAPQAAGNVVLDTYDVEWGPLSNDNVVPDVERPSVHDLFLQRRTIRKFRQTPIPAETISKLIRSAHQCTESKSDTLLYKDGYRLYLVESASDPSTRRLLEFDELSTQMRPVDTPRVPELAPSLYVDACFQSAPAAIWIVGNLRLWNETLGARGHQLMLFHAGNLANHLWLSALKLNLHGGICAGLIPHIARRELGFDGWERSPICAVLLGA